MIDDLPAARPQSGLSTASIVWQAPVNGGVDRYMVVYQESDATTIGPVRSARQFYVRWASEYHAMLCHYGSDVFTTSVVLPPITYAGAVYDLDGLAGNGGAYHRIGTRPAPHNVYTSSATLEQWRAKLGYPATFAGVPMLTFADDAPLDQRPTSGSISVPYRGQTIGYTYDRAANAYLRSVDGHPEIDASNGKQVVARNVIVLFQTIGTDLQPGLDYSEPLVGQIGSGTALVFRDGKAINAKWSKKNDTDLTRLFDSGGNPITFVRGEIFFQVVSPQTHVGHK